MKRLILHVVVMLITFAFGAAIDRVVWSHLERDVPAAQPQPVLVSTPEPHLESTPIFVPAATPIAAPTPHLILDYDHKGFDVYGAFYVMGPETKEFKDFYIAIDLAGHHDQPSGYISVGAHTKDSDRYDDYPAVFGLVTERRLFFVTSQGSQSPVEYRFDGEFLRKDFDSVAGKNKAVLRGTLTKTQNGRTIAERVVKLRMEYMGC